MTTINDQPKPKRRWLRFRLRTFLIVFTILTVWLGWCVYRADRQREAVAWIKENGGNAYYYQFDSDGVPIMGNPAGATGLLNILDHDYFASVSYVSLNESRVSDLTPLENLTNLKVLLLGDTQVSDLTPLANLTNLKSLELGNTQVSDLTPLAGLTNLEYLSLRNTQVSDTTPLAGLTNLKSLYLCNTVIGVAKLKKTLPACNIILESPHQSVAAEWVLGTGGSIEIFVDGRFQLVRGIQVFQSLSEGRYTVVKVNLSGLVNLVDDDLRHLKSFAGLEILKMVNTKIRSTGLVHISNRTSPNEIYWDRNGVRDGGIKHPILGDRKIDGIGLVTDEELERIVEVESLTHVDIGFTNISNNGLAHLSKLQHLAHLSFGSDLITDEGLRNLHSLKTLVTLAISESSVTKDGIAALRKALPKCRISWVGDIPGDAAQFEINELRTLTFPPLLFPPI